MQTESITETAALQFHSQPMENSDGLILWHVEHSSSAEGLPSDSCKTAASSQACWEVTMFMILMILAGFVIVALFYCVILLRHKLHQAQAGYALEYFGFYHMASYTLKHLQVHEPPSVPSLDPNPLVEVPTSSPPPTVGPSDLVIPSLLMPPPPLSSRPPSVVPLPLPIIHTTPPSPKSDAEIYSRIGTLQPTRHSGVSQAQVVLFEHSSL